MKLMFLEHNHRPVEPGNKVGNKQGVATTKKPVDNGNLPVHSKSETDFEFELHQAKDQVKNRTQRSDTKDDNPSHKMPSKNGIANHQLSQNVEQIEIAATKDSVDGLDIATTEKTTNIRGEVVAEPEMLGGKKLPAIEDGVVLEWLGEGNAARSNRGGQTSSIVGSEVSDLFQSGRPHVDSESDIGDNDEQSRAFHLRTRRKTFQYALFAAADETDSRAGDKAGEAKIVKSGKGSVADTTSSHNRNQISLRNRGEINSDVLKESDDTGVRTGKNGHDISDNNHISMSNSRSNIIVQSQSDAKKNTPIKATVANLHNDTHRSVDEPTKTKSTGVPSQAGGRSGRIDGYRGQFNSAFPTQVVSEPRIEEQQTTKTGEGDVDAAKVTADRANLKLSNQLPLQDSDKLARRTLGQSEFAHQRQSGRANISDTRDFTARRLSGPAAPTAVTSVVQSKSLNSPIETASALPMEKHLKSGIEGVLPNPNSQIKASQLLDTQSSQIFSTEALTERLMNEVQTLAKDIHGVKNETRQILPAQQSGQGISELYRHLRSIRRSQNNDKTTVSSGEELENNFVLQQDNAQQLVNAIKITSSNTQNTSSAELAQKWHDSHSHDSSTNDVDESLQHSDMSEESMSQSPEMPQAIDDAAESSSPTRDLKLSKAPVSFLGNSWSLTSSTESIFSAIGNSSVAGLSDGGTAQTPAASHNHTGFAGAPSQAFTDNLKLMVSQQGGRASFSFQTSTGERLHIEMKVHEGSAELSFKVQNPVMAQQLEQTVHELARTLKNSGIELRDVDIQYDDGASGHAGDSNKGNNSNDGQSKRGSSLSANHDNGITNETTNTHTNVNVRGSVHVIA